MIAWRVAGWFEWDASLRAFGKGIRTGFDKLLTLSYRWHTDHASGEVISALDTYSWAAAGLIDDFSWGILPVVAATLAAVVVLAFVAWPVALVMLGVVVLFGLYLKRKLRGVIAAAVVFSDTHSMASGHINDVISNITTVISQSGQEAEREAVAELVEQSLTADFVARGIHTRVRFGMESLLGALSWLSLLVGVILAVHHDLRAGAVYLILFYSAQVSTSLQQSFESIRSISQSLGKANKLVAIAQAVPEVIDVAAAPEIVVHGGRIEFENVSFGYTDKLIFDGLNLVIKPGEKVGLVGASGGGKSSITRLVLRFMDPGSGVVLIDGQNIAACTQVSLRRSISSVPQDPQLLHRSIAENIWYGSEGPIDYEILEAIGRSAHVHEFVQGLADGYDTVVGERGLKLSGGQRQRVATAQAMLKHAPIVILDEATSALDSESEQLVQDALWKLMSRSTAIVVAHRLSTIAHMDRIIVIEDGKIVEQGSHRELLAHGGLGPYGRLWTRQSGGFLSD
jgi:ATP-binding cassette subfamily B protein